MRVCHGCAARGRGEGRRDASARETASTGSAMLAAGTASSGIHNSDSNNPFEYREFATVENAVQYLSQPDMALPLSPPTPQVDTNNAAMPASPPTAQNFAAAPAPPLAVAAAPATAPLAAPVTTHSDTSAPPKKKARKRAGSKSAPKSTVASRWEDKFQELFRYKMQHGHCNVSAKSKDADLKKLGEWVRTQR